MSRFNKYNEAEYIDGLRKFLNEPKKDFLVRAGFVDENNRKTGRLRGYCPEALDRLERRVNEKSSYANAAPEDSTVGDRLLLARDYEGVFSADIASALGFSREMIRRWSLNLNEPSCFPELAEFLNVPQPWLQFGGVESLKANSHVGLLVGEAYRQSKERLYDLTVEAVSNCSMSQVKDGDFLRAYLEYEVFNNQEMAALARAAGGRWQALNGSLYFAPWEPLPERPLQRQFWNDEVEAIIAEELANSHSVYAAWNNLSKRCLALGYSKDDFPKRISLHKRMERERDLIEKFGLDLNDQVARSVALHAQTSFEDMGQ